MMTSTEKEIRIEEGESRISELAFAGLDYLERLLIPDSVREIGNYAFMNCYALREIQSLIEKILATANKKGGRSQTYSVVE